jgi:ribosomal protein S18 acetylase RimI-like enzyme
LDPIKDDAEINQFLAVAYAGASARPGDGWSEVWLGARDEAAGGGLAGVVALTSHGDGGPMGVASLAVAPWARCRGLGSALLIAAARHAMSLPNALGFEMAELGVYTREAASIALYERLGFNRGPEIESYGPPQGG